MKHLLLATTLLLIATSCWGAEKEVISIAVAIEEAGSDISIAIVLGLFVHAMLTD